MNTVTDALAHQIATARAAQQAWSGVPIRRRVDRVERFRRLIVDECERLCAAIGEDVGKPPVEVISGEVLPTADACVFLRNQAERILRPCRPPGGSPLWMSGQSHWIHRRPRGVVGIIGTWNYPLFLNGVQMLQALAAGNAVIWKPSEVAPKFAALFAEFVSRSDFPAGLFQALPATREMGPVLASADVDHIVFTGSADVGRKLAARLGERLISSTLELSGCDMMLVLPDADVALAAQAACFGVTVNRGQTCIAVRRVFIHRSIYKEFCDRLRLLVQGAAPARLALPSQVAQVARLVDEARSDGARLLVERDMAADTRECPLTVLLDAKPEMAVCREASFAPVMAVMPYDSVEEALAGERQCSYALAASIFTRDTAQARRIAGGLRAGHVTINEVVVPTAHPGTPFGGAGESGWGVTQGAEGLLEMTVPQAVSVVTTRFRPYYDLADPEKAARVEGLLRGLLQASHGAGLWDRLKGWWRVIRGGRGS